MIFEKVWCFSISAGPIDTGLSTKTAPAIESEPNCATYAATSCAPWDQPTSTGCEILSLVSTSCRSRARPSGEFPSVVFVDSPCDRGSTAMTRPIDANVFNCSDQRYAGRRQPGISTSTREEAVEPDCR